MSTTLPSAVGQGSGDLAKFAVLLERAADREPQFATEFVDRLLQLARDSRASDVHLDPTGESLRVRWRLDGVLQPLAELPKALAPNVIARLKVLAGLLTYEQSLPQEGRIWDEMLQVEVRVSTFPTLFGERAMLRMLGTGNQSLEALAQLGFPPGVESELARQLAATSGAVLVVGPAGSGKTTTAYAALRHIVAVSQGGRSIASLEDPVEVAVDGVAQSQINLAAGFDMSTGLRSLLRLDPEVILIGEMRDRTTAEIALQAALTGQLVVTTFHAGNSAEALHRLMDIGVPAYAVRNAVRLVVAQRLVRRLCICSQPGDVEVHVKPLALAVDACRVPGSCDACRGTGYAGRALIAEWRTVVDGNLEAALAAPAAGLWSSAAALVAAGTTSPAEVVRILGIP